MGGGGGVGRKGLYTHYLSVMNHSPFNYTISQQTHTQTDRVSNDGMVVSL